MISPYVRAAWTGVEYVPNPDNIAKIGTYFVTPKVTSVQMIEGFDKYAILTFEGMSRFLLAEFSSRNARNRWLETWKDIINVGGGINEYVGIPDEE